MITFTFLCTGAMFMFTGKRFNLPFHWWTGYAFLLAALAYQWWQVL